MLKHFDFKYERAILVLVASLFALALLCSAPVHASPLSSWEISCAVDRGSIKRKGRTWVFKTSSNRCSGGTFNQRAEIKSKGITPIHKGAYKFESHISIKSNSNHKFTIFQIHDGRSGCRPPLKLDVLPSGKLKLVSAYKIGSAPGENCVNFDISKSNSKATVRRDGTEYKLEVLLEFDGTGSFSVWVSIDDVRQIAGRYEFSEGKGYFKSKKFYFKHGSYSKDMFKYELTSRDMRVRKVKLTK